MLRELLWAALKRKDWSMRRASLEAGLGDTYLRDLKNDPSRDPGVGAVMALASVLDIPREDVLRAIENEIGTTQERSQRERAARVLGQMSRDELAAFLASHKNRPQ